MWALASSFHDGSVGLVPLINGVIGGMAGVTGAAGYVSAQAALALGVVIGGASFYGARLLETHRARVDDALDVTAVHGLAGVVGIVFVGVAAVGASPGLVAGGGGGLLGRQTLAAALVVGYSAVVMLVAVAATRRCFGARFALTDEEDRVGLDRLEYEEQAYHYLGDDVVTPATTSALGGVGRRVNE